MAILIPMASPVPMLPSVLTSSPVMNILQASQDILQAALHTAWLRGLCASHQDPTRPMGHSECHHSTQLSHRNGSLTWG